MWPRRDLVCHPAEKVWVGKTPSPDISGQEENAVGEGFRPQPSVKKISSSCPLERENKGDQARNEPKRKNRSESDKLAPATKESGRRLRCGLESSLLNV